MGNLKPYAILLKAVKIGKNNFGELLVIRQICQSFLPPMFLPYGIRLLPLTIIVYSKNYTISIIVKENIMVDRQNRLIAHF